MASSFFGILGESAAVASFPFVSTREAKASTSVGAFSSSGRACVVERLSSSILDVQQDEEILKNPLFGLSFDGDAAVFASWQNSLSQTALLL